MRSTVRKDNFVPVAVAETLAHIAELSCFRVISFVTPFPTRRSSDLNENAQTLTITSVNNAVGGTVAINGANVEFTPTPDYNGPASFDYTIRDKIGRAHA